MLSPTGTGRNQCMRNQHLLAVVSRCALFLMAHFFKGNSKTAKGNSAFGKTEYSYTKQIALLPVYLSLFECRSSLSPCRLSKALMRNMTQ